MQCHHLSSDCHNVLFIVIVWCTLSKRERMHPGGCEPVRRCSLIVFVMKFVIAVGVTSRRGSSNYFLFVHTDVVIAIAAVAHVFWSTRSPLTKLLPSSLCVAHNFFPGRDLRLTAVPDRTPWRVESKPKRVDLGAIDLPPPSGN